MSFMILRCGRSEWSTKELRTRPSSLLTSWLRIALGALWYLPKLHQRWLLRFKFHKTCLLRLANLIEGLRDADDLTPSNEIRFLKR